MASPGRDIQFLHCPDSLMPAATVLSMISRASLDGTLQPQAPSVSLPPLGKVGGGGCRGKAAFGVAFEIVTQSLGLRERSALLGM